MRFLQGWVAMLPAQLLSVLHHPLCMPSSYPPFAYAKDGHPHLWWLLQFENRAARLPLGFRDGPGVASRLDLAHDDHQNSTFLFRLR